MLDLASKQLGTVGGGNHYVDLFRDEDDRIWVGVHFGSRGFGHKTASRYFGDGPMDAARAAPDRTPSVGQEYIAAMSSRAPTPTPAATSWWTRCSRSSAPNAVEFEVHNHHNYAWHETHDGETGGWSARAPPRPSPASRDSSARRWPAPR
jgi:tRNA-splicing ligase RtcB